MSQQKQSSVHRYFPLADSFVEVRQLEPEVEALNAPHGLDLSSYRHLVINTCMPQFDEELADELARLFPEDPDAAEELLYTLCVEVNPSLEIHNVRLRMPGQEVTAEASERPKGQDGQTHACHDLAQVARNLERVLGQRIHGQDRAVSRLCRAVERAAAGLSAPARPLGSFLLVGRTGTGKTELGRQLARALAQERGNDAEGLIRIDCSEYALAHEYSKLIGSPPGYVGHEEGGQLTRALARNPHAVVLFDEIEKAHPRMHGILLQALEEGCMTDGRGQRVSLEQNFVLMTSNAGAEEIRGASSAVGFHRTRELGDEALYAITDRALEQQFSPELLGRLDEVILFSELDLTAARLIAQDHLTDLAVRARRRGARVAFTPAVANWVASRGFSTRFGARELRSVIQREIEPQLARLLLNGEGNRGSLIRARIRANELRFSVEE